MLASGATVGFVNGAGYVWGRLPHPFIITLATLSIARGLALRLSGGQPKRGMPEIVRTIGGGSVGWVPYSAFLVAAIAVVVAVVLSRLVWGRWIYATGGNPEAGRRTGIPVPSVLISVYVLCGLWRASRPSSRQDGSTPAHPPPAASPSSTPSPP